MIHLATMLMAVLITIGMTPVLRALAFHYNAVDVPNERKIHSRAIPRIGGLAMALGTFAPLLYTCRGNGFLAAYLAGAAVLVLFGVVDDFRELSPKVKFFGQVVAAVIAVFWGGLTIRNFGTLLPDGWLLPTWVGIPLTIFVIVGVTNAINLSDGLDGLAGGICLLIFVGIAYLAYLEGNTTVGLVSIALGGALFGFLRFNTHPASIFMGDSGSQFLGFSAIALSLSLTQGHPTPLSPVLPLIFLGFPILDTLTVMVTRISRGRSPFSADKNHFHHHLLGLGLRHAESVLVIYVIQTLLVITALVLRYYSDWLLFCGYLAFSAMILFLFDRARGTGWQPHSFDLFDIRIAGRLRIMKRDGIVIKKTFPVFKFCIPLLFLLTCSLVGKTPIQVKAAAVLGVLAIAVTWFVKRQGLGWVLRIILYLLVPFAVYLGEAEPDPWLPGYAKGWLNAMFCLFPILIMVISKFSRRQNGFKSSPMDFLIVILAVAIPNLPGSHIQQYQVGLIAAKIIVLYFSFEVLLAELRGRYASVAGATAASLLVLASH